MKKEFAKIYNRVTMTVYVWFDLTCITLYVCMRHLYQSNVSSTEKLTKPSTVLQLRLVSFSAEQILVQNLRKIGFKKPGMKSKTPLKKR